MILNILYRHYYRAGGPPKVVCLSMVALHCADNPKPSSVMPDPSYLQDIQRVLKICPCLNGQEDVYTLPYMIPL